MSKQQKLKIMIVVFCVISFGAGLSVPLLMQRTSTSFEQTKFNEVYSTLLNNWYYAKDTENLDRTLMEKAMVGMADLDRDPNTSYFTLTQAKEFASQLEGSGVGVGFSYYESQGNIQITHVYINSAADQAGLQKGDVITKVDSKVCKTSGIDDVVSYIQKKEGKSIQIEYTRDDKTKTVKVIPGAFDSTVSLEMNDDHAVVTVNSFSQDTGKDFATAMKRAQKNGKKKLILDLRDNTGGYIISAIDVASTLISPGDIVYREKNADGKVTKYYTNDVYKQVKFDKIVVLQNDKTASASEALIGALKDNLTERVTTIGTTTYGKGTEQEQKAFKDGTSMKYTTAEWLTPSGKSINNKGFKPDIKVKLEQVRTIEYKKFKKNDVIKPDTVTRNAKALQIYLDYIGYSVDRKDMYFSEYSSASLAAFQTDHHLKANGNCDYKTWNALVDQVYGKVNEMTDAQVQKAIDVMEGDG